MVKQPAANAALAPLPADCEAVDEQASLVPKIEHWFKKAPTLRIDQLMVLFMQQISWKKVDYARYLVGAGINGHETVLVG